MLPSQFEELTTRLMSFYERSEEDLYTEYAPLELHVATTDHPVPWEQRLGLTYRTSGEGDAWGHDWQSGWFHVTGRIPESWDGRTGVMRLNLGGECLVYDENGAPLCGLTNTSVYHPGTTKEVFYWERPFRGGEIVDLWVEAAANNILGPEHFNWNPHAERETHPAGVSTGVVRIARMALWNEELYQFRVQFWQLWYYVEFLGKDGNNNVCRRIVHAMNKALDAYRGDPRRAGEAMKELAPVWSWRAKGSAPRCTAIGHAHIDVGWLWPVRESVRKAARTFSSQLRLFKRHPEYRFGASQPQLYQFVKDRYPALYERIRQAVHEGRWECQGGMWVEADNNMPSGESLVRQFLHGKNFYRDEFGVEVRNLWLPDVFGYNGNTPQIMRICGCDFFLTQKLSWNTIHKPPYSTFRWKGVDGSQVATHFPPENDYNSCCSFSLLARAQDRLQESAILPEFLSLFGLGDGGGGPNEDYVARAKLARDWEGVPKVKMGFAQPFFDRVLDHSPELPVWEGELYFENHRGTLTSQARTKRNNRKLEERLWQTEALCSLLPAGKYPRKELERICKLLLINQFHDIIPGSSIRLVYDRTEKEHAQCLKELSDLLDQAARELFAPENDALVFYNSLSTPYERPLVLPEELSGCALVDEEGRGIPCQRESTGHLVAEAQVPAWGFRTLRANSGVAPEECLQDRELILENDRVRYVFDKMGRLLSAVDLTTGQEFLTAPGNAFYVFQDTTAIYDAWNIDPWYRGEELPWEPTLLEEPLRETGPVRQVLRFRFAFLHSTLEQEISLDRKSARLEFCTTVEWHESHKMLRVAFPTNVHSDEASFQIQYGVMKRATHTNTSHQQVQFEVCAHRYADLSDKERGAALLNDGKYGHSVRGGVMELNLLRSPKWPDYNADQGTQYVTYAFLPHQLTLADSTVSPEAAMLNREPWLFPGFSAGTLAFPVRVEGEGVSWEVLKRAEKNNDWILRVVETRGRHATGKLFLDKALHGYAPFRMDAIEWEDGEPLEALREGGYAFSLKPYQILTICLSDGSRPMPGIILASRSPRRKELLVRAGVVFEADPAQGAEASWDGVMTPGEHARMLSCQKAKEVSLRHPGKLTLGADTVVAMDDQIFGKPAGLEEAKGMLRELSGRSHLVVTGTTLAKDGKVLASWQTNTRVCFRELSEEDIEKYLASIDPLDKAGAYAIQEHGDRIVEEIHGLFSNVVGLPVEQVLPLLRAARDGMLAGQW